jgi:DNA-binding MarR family transcriptional regulator
MTPSPPERTHPPSRTEEASSSGTGAGPQSQLADVVARLRRAMRRAARAANPGHQLSVAQMELLACLAEHPGARPGQLARHLRLAPNSVTTLVNALVAQGVVARTSGGPDRRTVALRLTPAGTATLQRWQATNAAILNSALAAVPTGRQHALRAALPALDQLIVQVDTLADHPERVSAQSVLS